MYILIRRTSPRVALVDLDYDFRGIKEKEEELHKNLLSFLPTSNAFFFMRKAKDPTGYKFYSPEVSQYEKLSFC